VTRSFTGNSLNSFLYYPEYLVHGEEYLLEEEAGHFFQFGNEYLL